VRTIQRSETAKWVSNLGKQSRYYVPLPVVPRTTFSGLIVLHNGTAREFDVDWVEPVVPPVNDPVGAQGTVTVRAKTRIHVKKGPKRLGRALIRGFQGIRYVRTWSSVAQTTGSGGNGSGARPPSSALQRLRAAAERHSVDDKPFGGSTD
jgi:hypothetical protein